MSKSFCIKVCEYGEDGRTCKGCFRTSEEITEWFYASKERKVEIAQAARKRAKEQRSSKQHLTDK